MQMNTKAKSTVAIIVTLLLFIGLFTYLLNARAPNYYIALLIPAIGLLLLNYITRTKAIVLWLRKFNPNENKYRPSGLFQSAGKYTLLTLQDESYPFSVMDFVMNRPITIFFACAAFPPIMACLIFLPSYLIFPEYIATSPWFIAFLLVVSVAVLRYISMIYMAKLQSTKVMSVGDVALIPQLARNIRAHGATPFPKIFSCTNAKWKSLVTSMVDIADAIFIDISEITMNMQWEVLTAISHRPGNKIILLVETGGDPAWTRDKLRERLFDRALDSRILKNFQSVKIIKYTASERIGGRANFRDILRKNQSINTALLKAIDEAIAN